MRAVDLDRIPLGELFRTFVPDRRASRIARDTLILGFDTEFTSAPHRLLTVQLAASHGGRLVSEVFPIDDGDQLDPVLLSSIVCEFLEQVGIVPRVRGGCVRVALCAHYAAADLAGFGDPFRDLDIFQVGKGHHARLDPILFDDDGPAWKLRIVDLFAYFKTSLAKIGTAVGLKKLEIDIENIETVMRDHPDEFRAYAVRDAEIAYLAFSQFRDRLLGKWEVDPLLHPTVSSVAGAVFRRHFLERSPASSSPSIQHDRFFLVDGTVFEKPRKARRYSGPPDRRLAACRALKGGRVEAYVRGLVVRPLMELDVDSLYPHAALLQPLPHAGTRWRAVTCLKAVAELEGFGCFDFKFDSSFSYPCLPVMRENESRLLFPSRGRTWCTLSEVRLAIKLGAHVKVIDAHGFLPGRNETEHDVGKYMKVWLEAKNDASRGSFDFSVAKNMLNTLIGKFGQRHGGTDPLADERRSRRGHDGAVFLQSKMRTGPLFVPEWNALIVGRGRAIASEIASIGALLISTDSFIFDKDKAIESDAIDALHRVGSRLRLEREADAAFIARSRLYALLRRSAEVDPGEPVLARDDDWAVVRVARHGTTETKEQMAETVLRCIAERRDVAPIRERTRLLSAEAALREGKSINEEVVEARKTKFTWDWKRKLTKRDVNPFADWSATSPYVSPARAAAAERISAVRRGEKRPRRRRHASRLVDDAVRLLKSGVGVRAVSRATSIPRSTVSDLKQRLLKGRVP